MNKIFMTLIAGLMALSLASCGAKTGVEVSSEASGTSTPAVAASSVTEDGTSVAPESSNAAASIAPSDASSRPATSHDASEEVPAEIVGSFFVDQNSHTEFFNGLNIDHFYAVIENKPCFVMMITNHSKDVIKLDADLEAVTNADQTLDAETCRICALAPDQTSCISTTYAHGVKLKEIKYRMGTQILPATDSIYHDLSIIQQKKGEDVVFSVENNGKTDASKVRVFTVFVKGGKMTGFSEAEVGDNGSGVPAGKAAEATTPYNGTEGYDLIETGVDVCK